MTDNKLESRILYFLVFILIGIVLTLISVMPFSLTDINVSQGLLNSMPNFFGALVGAVLTGGTAIGILLYQKYNERKSALFKSYGSMKYIAVKLVEYPELQKLFLAIVELKQSADLAATKHSLDEKLLDILPINQFTKLLSLLKQEREQIPYEFVSRYFTVINNLEYIVSSLERLRQDSSEMRIKNIILQLELGEDITKRFRDNLFVFTLEVEKKYGIKDAY